MEQYEAEKKLRGKGKDELLQMLDASAEENQVLKNQLEEFKIEFEETKLQHRNEVRAQETKSHEHWVGAHDIYLLPFSCCCSHVCCVRTHKVEPPKLCVNLYYC